MLRRIVKLHYDYKYAFLRPSIKEVTERYALKWPQGKSAPHRAMDAAVAAAATTADAATADAATADATTADAATADAATAPDV